MTNYNDGKWHGWNGGECPVHPKSMVDAVWHDANQETTGIRKGPALGGAAVPGFACTQRGRCLPPNAPFSSRLERLA